MNKKLLSFVTSKEGDQVSIHLDKDGLEKFINELQFLKKALDKGDCEHTHLMSSDWGGDELSLSKLDDQEREVNQVHDVKIYAWNDEWKKKHGLVV